MADVLLHGGTIHVDAQTTTDQLALADGLVLALGGDASEVADESTERVDLDGAVVWPGFHEAHGHVLAGSFIQERILLLGLTRMEALADAAETYAADHPEEPWILGYGYVPQLMDEVDGRLLDGIERPCALIASSGHEAVVNTAALRLAGIDVDSQAPPGGTFVVDGGELTGRLLESAMGPVIREALGAYDDDDLTEPLAETLRSFADAGLTSVSDILAAPGVDLSRPWVYTALEAEGRLPVRVFTYLPVQTAADVAPAVALGRANESELVRFAGLKLWVDGTLGNREGWTTEAYESTGTTGAHYVDRQDLIAVVRAAEEQDARLKLHAMGDEAIDAVLDALEAVAEENGVLAPGHAVEHASLLTTAARERMAALGVVASVQPVGFVSSSLSAGWHEDLPSWDLDNSYDFGGLVDAGVDVALGTDWPVWPSIAPLANLSAAVRDRRARPLTVEEAMHAYTAGGADSVGASSRRGRLTVGSEADLVVLDVDPVGVAPEALLDVEVLETWVAGERVR